VALGIGGPDSRPVAHGPVGSNLLCVQVVSAIGA